MDLLRIKLLLFLLSEISSKCALCLGIVPRFVFLGSNVNEGIVE